MKLCVRMADSPLVNRVRCYPQPPCIIWYLVQTRHGFSHYGKLLAVLRRAVLCCAVLWFVGCWFEEGPC
jgi:hypothetical protein